MSGLSQDITQLVLWRALQGIGGGIITANAFTIVGDLFAARERGRWQGLIGSVFGLSSLVGPLLGGWLTDGHGIFGVTTDWRWTFYINVPIGIVAFILIAIYCPALRSRAKQAIDYLGAAFLTVALAVLILSVDNTDNIFAGLLDATGMSLLTLRLIMWSIVAAAVALFIYVEYKAKEPIIPLRFFKNRNFVLLTSVSILFGGAFLGSILFLTQFNQQVFGATPTESGLMLLPMVGGIMLSSILSGQIISRIGTYKWFLRVGFVVATIAMTMLTFMHVDTGYLYEAIVMTLLGLGMGVAMPVINLAVQNEFSQRELGVATSSTQLFRSLGSTIGTAVFTSLLTLGLAGSVVGLQQTQYVQAVEKTPAVQQLGELDDPNTYLTLNTVGKSAELPPQLQQARDEFSTELKEAFAESVRHIFVVATIMVGMSTVLVFLVKERKLKESHGDETPGMA
jgi:EmrB/QacA subfamily drug resistance transporter